MNTIETLFNNLCVNNRFNLDSLKKSLMDCEEQDKFNDLYKACLKAIKEFAPNCITIVVKPVKIGKPFIYVPKMKSRNGRKLPAGGKTKIPNPSHIQYQLSFECTNRDFETIYGIHNMSVIVLRSQLLDYIKTNTKHFDQKFDKSFTVVDCCETMDEKLVFECIKSQCSI